LEDSLLDPSWYNNINAFSYGELKYMYCPKCGQQNPEGSKYCRNCGTLLADAVEATGTTEQSSPTSSSQPQPVLQAGRNSGMAVAALVLGIIGLFFNILGVLAIIFGAIAISQINREPGLQGKGMAVAGLVLGIVSIAVWILIIVFVSSAFWMFSAF
jgi:ribosomal protein L40E